MRASKSLLRLLIVLWCCPGTEALFNIIFYPVHYVMCAFSLLSINPLSPSVTQLDLVYAQDSIIEVAQMGQFVGPDEIVGFLGYVSPVVSPYFRGGRPIYE